MMMRTKGVTGPAFAKHIGVKGLSKAGGAGNNTLPPGSDLITTDDGVILVTTNGEAIRT